MVAKTQSGNPKAAQVIRENAPQASTTVEVFEGMFHEVHNEPDQEAVLQTIASWIAEQLAEIVSSD